MAEQYAKPGDVIVGADSHTCTGGALGAFATGMGSTDVAVAIALGKIWMRVPETIKVVAKGSFQKGVYGKDLILHLIARISSRGAIYKALEFTGEAIENLSMSGRYTLSNMAVEAGAKVGIVPPDDTTLDFLKYMGREKDFKRIASDSDADFERIIEIDVDSLKPTIACPHLVDNVKAIEDIGKVKVHQVFIGTSCNGRLEDFHIAASIMKGRKVHPLPPVMKRILEEGGLVEYVARHGGLVIE